jgi:DNA-binding CsgD family transcriptional regulator
MMILLITFYKQKDKLFLYLFAFVLLSTFQLAFATFATYRYVNIVYEFTHYNDLINCILLCFIVIIAPLLMNSWLKISSKKINNVFFTLFIVSLGLVLVPFFFGMLKERYIFSLPSSKLLLGILIFTCVYSLFTLVRNFTAITDRRERTFIWISVACLSVEVSQLVIPIIKSFPENEMVYATVYFIWNMALLRYVLNRYILSNASNESLHETIGRMGLTEREKEIAILLLHGESNKTISNKLHISEDTVKTHVKNIYRKLDVNNRVQLINTLMEKSKMINI